MDIAKVQDLSVKHRVVAFDSTIGDRLKHIRLMLGLTQSTVADILGITFQQIQKYEQGVNRLSASTLWRLSQFFGVNVSSFFPVEENTNTLNDSANDKGCNSLSDMFLNIDMRTSEIVSLVKSYYNIKDPKVRKSCLALIASLSSTEEEKN